MAAMLALSLLTAVLLGGCSVTSGVFTGMSQSSTETSLSASYVSFDGMFSRQVPLKSGEEVTFSLSGDDGLNAYIESNGEEVLRISDGSAYTAPEDAIYIFAVKGKAENGAFSLTWEVD